jgi:hypothetical protein
MLSPDTSTSLILGLGGLLVSIIGTIVGYKSYKAMKEGCVEGKIEPLQKQLSNSY